MTSEDQGRKQETHNANLGRGDVGEKQIRVSVKFMAIDVAGIKWGRDDVRLCSRGVWYRNPLNISSVSTIFVKSLYKICWTYTKEERHCNNLAPTKPSLGAVSLVVSYHFFEKNSFVNKSSLNYPILSLPSGFYWDSDSKKESIVLMKQIENTLHALYWPTTVICE